MVTHGVAGVAVLVNPFQATRLSEHFFGPVAFRPMVTHGVVLKEATRLSTLR